MSLQKINKILDLKPEKQILEAHQGPSKTLKETIEVMVSNRILKHLLTWAMIGLLTVQQKNIKAELREVEHYIEKCEGSGKVVKAQLEEQLMKNKQEMVKLERMLEEEIEAAGEEEDVFDKEDQEADRQLRSRSSCRINVFSSLDMLHLPFERQIDAES